MSSTHVSSLAGILSTACIIENFNTKDFGKFKRLLSQKYLVSHLQKLKSPNSIASYLLGLFNQSRLNNEDICKIYRIACEISTKNHYGSNLNKCNDNGNEFMLLSSDQIDYISLFLSKKERIELGCVCRLLYIEMQNKSNVIKRRVSLNTAKENTLQLTVNTLLFLASYHNPSGFHHCFPLFLKLGKKEEKCDFNYKRNWERIEKLMRHESFAKYFENFFYCVKAIKIHSSLFCILPYIACNLLFNLKNNNHENLKLFEFNFDVFDGSDNEDYSYTNVKSQLKQFSQNYQNYFSGKCKNNFEKIRKLETLRIHLNDTRYTHDRSDIIVSICEMFEGNYTNLCIEFSSMDCMVLSVSSFNVILHKNLEFMYITDDIHFSNVKAAISKIKDNNCNMVIGKRKNKKIKSSLKRLTMSGTCFLFWRSLCSMNVVKTIEELSLTEMGTEGLLEGWIALKENDYLRHNVLAAKNLNIKILKLSISQPKNTIYGDRESDINLFGLISYIFNILIEFGSQNDVKNSRLTDIFIEWRVNLVSFEEHSGSNLLQKYVADEDMPQFETQDLNVIVKTDLSQESIVNVYRNLFHWQVRLFTIYDDSKLNPKANLHLKIVGN